MLIVQGDASSKEQVLAAIKGQDAIIQAAVFGAFTPIQWLSDQSASLESQRVVANVIDAAVEVQASRDASPGQAQRLRLWNVAGQVLLDMPGYPGKIIGDVIHVHPEHYANYAYLLEHGTTLDWSVICPGGVAHAEVSYVRAILVA